MVRWHFGSRDPIQCVILYQHIKFVPNPSIMGLKVMASFPKFKMAVIRHFGIVMTSFNTTTVEYGSNSTWLDSTRLDSTHSTCRAHAFWLCRASRTAQLDSLDTTSSTGSTRRARLARHVKLDRRYLQLSYDHRNSFIV